MRIRWVDVALMSALYAGALAARWVMIEALPYNDEGLHWYNSRHWLQKIPDNMVDVHGSTWFHAWWIGLQRPAWYILFMPAAKISFEAWRTQVVLLTSLLPVAGYTLARAWATRRPAALAGGLLLALWPILVTFGGFGLMDELMTVLLLFGLAAFDRGRMKLAVALFLLACWTKELAVPVLGLFLVLTFTEEIRRGEASWWPIRLGQRSSILAIPILLGPVPFLLSLSKGLPFPGMGNPPYTLRLIDWLVGTAWLWPILIMGIAKVSTRRLALIGSGMAFYFLAWNLAQREVMIWYLMLPNSLAFVAVPAILDTWIRNRELKRGWGQGAAVFVSIILVTTIVVPGDVVEGRWLAPVNGNRFATLQESYAWELRDRDRDIFESLDSLPSGPGKQVLILDAEGSLVIARLAERGTRIVFGSPAVMLRFNQTIEAIPIQFEASDGAMARNDTTTIHQALITTYRDCAQDIGDWWVFDPPACRGRVDRFMSAFDNATGG